MSRLFVIALVAVAACRPAARPKLPLVTTSESSGWIKTGRYDEAVVLCRDFARAYEGVHCDEIGRTSQDRPIVAVRIARAAGKPTIYVQAGVHAGEIEGKDAGFWFLRDLLDGKVAAGALAQVNVVFVPCINPDGHERFGPNNRPNQRGPVEMGFRTNGVRTNLNRDLVKADSLEIQAVLGIVRAYEPLVFVDLHTTDGAKFQHDIAALVSPRAPRPDRLYTTARELSDQLMQRLTALGHLPLPFYPSFEKEDDPTSGFAIGEPPPRFSQAYAAARSRIGILVETHSWRTYKERAESTYHFLQALLERAATDAPAWQAAAIEGDRADQQLAGGELAVTHETGPHTIQLQFRGYAYETRASEISGGTWIVYDETRPEIWNIPLRDELVDGARARVPRAGYIIDGGFAALATPVFDRHGISYRPLSGQPRLDVEAFRATDVTFLPPYEGRPRVSLQGAWAREQRTLDRGAIFVPIAQAHPRLVVHLLDPAGPDSLAQWGHFISAFERKEYMEPYIAEEVAREQLAADPQLRAQFDAAIAADPEMAKSPAKRLEFFYKRHPSWDERLNLLPVYRVDTAPR